MSDANIATLAGSLLIIVQLAAVIIIRMLDYYFPKGRMSKKALRNSVKTDSWKEEEGLEDEHDN